VDDWSSFYISQWSIYFRIRERNLCEKEFVHKDPKIDPHKAHVMRMIIDVAFDDPRDVWFNLELSTVLARNSGPISEAVARSSPKYNSHNPTVYLHAVCSIFE